MEDSVPRTIEGGVLSLADKVDSIAGMFALGLIPSGSRDPFALRRQANGIVRTIAEHRLPLALSRLFETAREAYRGTEAEKKFKSLTYEQDLRNFFRERLEFYLRDASGFAYDVVNAVLAAGSDDVVDAIARAGAVQTARAAIEFESVLTAFKRTRNILDQAKEKGMQIGPFDRMTATPREVEIYEAMQSAGAAFSVYFRRKDYSNAVAQIARLRQPIDDYFNSILVMDPDPAIRHSRLGFLNIMYEQFSTIADFSEIVTEGKKS
jgi:glycyl-tRNA synthetase beta chain